MDSFQDFVNSNKFSNQEKEKMQQDAKDLVNKYANMSQAELKYNLMQEVARQKQNGTFDKQKLKFMLDSIKGLISPQVYEQISNAINNL